MIGTKVWSRSSRKLRPSGSQTLSARGEMPSSPSRATKQHRAKQYRFFLAITASLLLLYTFLNGPERTVNSDEYSSLVSAPSPTEQNVTRSTGVIVLGMHRSGTSLLTGLLALVYGYSTGDNLIPAKRNNPKGFFEDANVVLENKRILASQDISDTNAEQLRSYRHDTHAVLSSNGQSALDSFNSQHTISPWILKDPRMCITLPEWLPHFDTQPAILLTERHPLEVARSMNKRSGKSIEDGLDVWLVYNQAAIRNSKGLCRVVTSNDAILKDPIRETTRIVEQLSTKCGVAPPPRRVPSKEVIDGFVDITLQKSKTGNLADWCIAKEISTKDTRELGFNTQLAKQRFEQAMKLYCDMTSGIAFSTGYKVS